MDRSRGIEGLRIRHSAEATTTELSKVEEPETFDDGGGSARNEIEASVEQIKCENEA